MGRGRLRWDWGRVGLVFQISPALTRSWTSHPLLSCAPATLHPAADFAKVNGKRERGRLTKISLAELNFILPVKVMDICFGQMECDEDDGPS